VTTKTAPTGLWQAVTPDGIAHWFGMPKPGVGAAWCDPRITTVEQRFAYGIKAHCIHCLYAVERARTRG